MLDYTLDAFNCLNENKLSILLFSLWWYDNNYAYFWACTNHSNIIKLLFLIN